GLEPIDVPTSKEKQTLADAGQQEKSQPAQAVDPARQPSDALRSPKEQASLRMVAETMEGPVDIDLSQSPAISINPQPLLPSRISSSSANADYYELIDLLGEGAMGKVYKARDRRLGRTVALKFLHGDSPRLIQRFMQEASAQARIEHENVCK